MAKFFSVINSLSWNTLWLIEWQRWALGGWSTIFWVVDQLHKELILEIDWLQHPNPVIDWVKYEVNLPSGFVVAAISVTSSPWVELCTLKGLLHTLRANKHAGSWFALVK